MNFTQLSDTVYVYGQILPTDLAEIKAQGFATVICNRPDGEEVAQPSAQEIQTASEALGIAFFYVPFNPSNPSENMVADFSAALDAAPTGKILAYCRSGNRSSRLWQATGCR